MRQPPAVGQVETEARSALDLGAGFGLEGFRTVEGEGLSGGIVLRRLVVTPKAGPPQRIARCIPEHVAVVVEMVLAAHAGISRVTPGNTELPVHAEAGVDIETHQHAHAKMPGPVVQRFGRAVNPDVLRQRLPGLRLLRRGTHGQAQKSARRPLQG